MRWWLKSFWEQFWPLLLWGDTKRKGVIKVINLVIALGVPSLASLLESPDTYVYIKVLGREVVSRPVPLGILVTIAAGLMWIIFAIGWAYGQSGIPKLVVDSELVCDLERYRLGLESQRKDLDTKVRLMAITDGDGRALIPGRFPLEMEWTHHPKESAVHLTAGIRESVSVATVLYNTGRAYLVFTGARHSGTVPLKQSEKAYFRILTDYPKRKPIERWFCFEDMGDSFRVSAEAPTAHVTQPQAALEASKHES